LDNPETPSPSRPDQSVVLLAEDDGTIRRLTKIVLEKEGYFVLTASDGEEALTLSGKYPGIIDALLTDVKMPRVDGLELTERILAERPKIKVMIMSGQVDDPLIRGVSFLRKPFPPPVLRDRMRGLLSSSSAQ
jgi:CheY-like chemotaxis protein